MRNLDATGLRERIDRDVFDYRQLVDALGSLQKPREAIGRWLARGDVIRIKKGLYVFSAKLRRGPLSRELLANLIYGPSYISLDYALSYHGLIPERALTVTSVSLERSRDFQTPLGVFAYRSLTLNRYTTGAQLLGDPISSFLMAGQAKALVDKDWTDKSFQGAALAEHRPYLLQDLRIDQQRLLSIPESDLEEVQDAYRSAKIDLLVRAIELLRAGSYA
jgi:hypothetical protein